MSLILTLLVVIGLSLGPVGRIALTHPITPSLVVIFLWTVSWFRSRDEALRLAIITGILLDLAGFSFFGLWTVSAISIVLVIAALKSRYLDSASLTHSLIALTVVSLIPIVLFSIVTKTFAGPELLLAIFGNVFLGAIVYYLLAMRLKLFSRWAGRRIG